MNFFGKTFKITLFLLFAAELLSLAVFLLPRLNNFVFLVILSAFLILCLIKLEYGVWVVLAELFIGSQGYLFFFEHGSLMLSIRIALWLVIMSVWFTKLIITITKNKSLTQLRNFYPKKFLLNRYFFLLSFFVLFGLFVGIMRGNQFSNIFFDFNGWLYFTLLLPFYTTINSEEKIKKTMQIFTAAILWLSLKSFLLLFIFSHNLFGFTETAYHWVRDTKVGEITNVQGGFFRIFIQSQIFIFIYFFISYYLILIELFKNKITNLKKNKNFQKLFFLHVLSAGVIILSMSRSFWLGLASGLIMTILYLIWDNRTGLFLRIPFVKIFKSTMLFVFVAAIAFLFVIITVKFPYPKPIGGFDASNLFADRATAFGAEAGASSRWALLPELKKQIQETPILGRGFGSVATYKTSDPRILQSSATGEYTTFAFEWGWLDMYLKIGLLGVLLYLFLIIKTAGFALGVKQENDLKYLFPGMAIALLAVVIVNFFSPYFNHPLGIGYLIYLAAILKNYYSLA